MEFHMNLMKGKDKAFILPTKPNRITNRNNK